MVRNCGSPSPYTSRCWSSLSFAVLAISSLPMAESFMGSSIINSGRVIQSQPVRSNSDRVRPSDRSNDHFYSASPSKIPRIRLSSDTTTSSSTAITTSNSEEGMAEQYDPNGIEPETKSITGSMVFFAEFVVKTMITNRLLKKKRTKIAKRKGARRKSFVENMAQLNEQRKNLVTLAGYNAHIVIPSFAFLLLGAITTSIVPLYESKCIQLVATLHPTKAKVVEALIGLVVSSTLASLFTGLRGSLFWLAGMFHSIYDCCAYPAFGGVMHESHPTLSVPCFL